MITGIDHVVIGVADIETGVSAYETLLRRAPEHRYTLDGVATTLFPTANTAVELMAPSGDGETAARLRAALSQSGEGLMSLVFAVNDIEQMHRRAERVGLTPEPISDGEAVGLHWRRFRASSESCCGLRLFFIERAGPIAAAGQSDVLALDHVVIRARDMERAAGLFGARLALDMRLDRDVGGRRLMFFRCGDLILEIAEDGAREARLYGLSWRVRDADVTHARLAAAGLNVSEVRDGKKPGTRVFTVRDRTCGIPTLMVETSPKSD